MTPVMMMILTANDSVTYFTELQEINDMINVSDLIITGHFLRLPKERRKRECLPHGSCGFVDIHLLTISSCPLERNTLWLSVDQDGAVDLTSIFPLCENIQ